MSISVNRVVLFLLCAFIAAPTIVIAGASFSHSELVQFPPEQWSLRWYAHALSRPEFRSAAWNSLWIAAMATSIGLPIALGASLAIVRGNIRYRETLQTILLAPLVVPSIVIGLSVLLATTRLQAQFPAPRMLAAHTLIVLPYLMRTISSNLIRVDPAAEEAARSLGANSFKAFWYVTLPALRPGVIAGVTFSFIISFDNVSISVFLAHAQTNTLPITLMSYVEYNSDPSVAAVSTLLVAMALIAAVVLERTIVLRRT